MRRLSLREARQLFRRRSWKFFQNPETSKIVSEIIAAVRERGDEALLSYTGRFDHIALAPGTMRVRDEEFESARARVENTPLGAALRHAYARIYNFHHAQLEKTWLTHTPGCILGQLVTALDSCGLYVPGGKASYPSTVLMNAIPALIAGVPRRVICSPAGQISDAVLYAALLCGIREFWKVGGAQAIAALAFGTESIEPVAKITGPGNKFVTEAKRQVYGMVSIDMLAGPSEIMIYADETSDPRYIARDLLSQAEHDEDASSILISSSPELLDRVDVYLAVHIAGAERKDIIENSISKNAYALYVHDKAEAWEIINLFAPEHLEVLASCSLEEVLGAVQNAGAIFFGHYSPEPLGDYIAGPNHTLPTLGCARFASPLGVYDFIKRSSVISAGRSFCRELIPDAALIARNEGLCAHEASLRVRESGEG
ncbi:MAG: histidinol dehydrogenase [Spirochaetota bacterium]|jgi:histidinol dehydrogenase|nr:histidinol dehydrogenase [Spirochaetota bacterium]